MLNCNWLSNANLLWSDISKQIADKTTLYFIWSFKIQHHLKTSFNFVKKITVHRTVYRSIWILYHIESHDTVDIDSQVWRIFGCAIIDRYSPFLRPNTGKILISDGPHLCVTYETMNGWQMFILVSDTVARIRCMDNSHEWQPPLNTGIAEPFVSTQRKYFHFLGHVWTLLVCLSAIWGYSGLVGCLLRFAAYWFHFDCE